jgi:hypothetical protein
VIIEITQDQILGFVYAIVFIAGIRSILGIPPLNRLWRKDLREKDRKVKAYEEELDARLKQEKAKAKLDDAVERNRRANR